MSTSHELDATVDEVAVSLPAAAAEQFMNSYITTQSIGGRNGFAVATSMDAAVAARTDTIPCSKWHQDDSVPHLEVVVLEHAGSGGD